MPDSPEVLLHAEHDSGLTPAPEHAPKSWIHPRTGEHHDLADLSLEERLRVIVDTTSMNEYDRLLQDVLFPPDTPVKPVNPDAFAHTELTSLSREQRLVRREIAERVYGIRSPRKAAERGSDDNVELHVGFTGDPEALTVMLNATPGMKRLAGIGQTDVRLQDDRLTRADHSQHLARMVVQTNIRMALQRPALYLRRVDTDMQRYSEMAGRVSDPFVLVPSESTKTAVARSIANGGVYFDATETEALLQATEYGKYLVMAAYLHDVMTPGWGDVFMKTRKRGDATVGVTFSEDEVLADSISHLLETEAEGLPEILAKHQINKDFLATMVASMASESDVCLGGFLMKDKRKFTAEQKEKYPHLDRGGVVDADQDSGMTANASDIVPKHLPGGFRHLKRNEDLPLGSFEDRLNLLSYALSQNISAEVIGQWCRELGINPESVFIAAEEITVGNNLLLEEVVFDDLDGSPAEILPIPTQAGDVKRMKMMMNVLTVRHFRSPQREPTEALVQTCIAYGKTADVVNDDMFIRRDDADVVRRLNDVAPVIPYVLETLQDQAMILTEMDLARLVNEAGQLENVLVFEEGVRGMVYRKRGTLIRREDATIKSAEHVLSVKRDMTDSQIKRPRSVPLMERLDTLERKLAETRLFKVFRLTDEQVDEIDRLLRLKPESESVMRQAFALWTKSVTIDDRIVSTDLAEKFAGRTVPDESV